jgi:O-antigen/teichoic acid export membrane protein
VIIVTDAKYMTMSIFLILKKFKFRDLLAQYGAAVAVAAISFMLTAAIARTVGAEQFGQYGVALAIGAILAIFLDFGFKQVIQREAALSSLSYSFRELQGTAIKNILAVALLFVIAGAVLFGNHLFLVVCIAICFVGSAFTQIISAGLRGQGYFVKDAWHQLTSRIVSAAAIILSLLFFPGFAVILFAWGAGTTVWAVYAFAKFSRPLLGPKVTDLYRYVTPLFLIDLMIVIHFRIDLIVMQGFGADRNFIGNYSAALRIVELFIFLTFPVRGMLLTQIRQENQKVMPTYMLIRCCVAVAIALLLATGTMFLAPYIIEVVFGAGFDQAVDLLRIMVWLLVPSFALAIIFETSVASNTEKAYRTAVAIIVALNVVSLTVVMQWGMHWAIAPLKVLLEIVLAALAFSLVFCSIRRIN